MFKYVNNFSICSLFNPILANSFSSSCLVIFSNLSIIVIVSVTSSFAIPASIIIPDKNFLLLYFITISIFNLLYASTYNATNSASVNCPSIPTLSTSH